MRKVCFALILVMAAFVGGAAVNGPGLDWLKAAIRARLLPPLSTNPTPADLAKRPTPPRDVPAAPLPPLTFDTLERSTAPPETTALPASTIEVATPPPKSDAQPLELAMPDTPLAPLPPSRTADPAVSPVSQAPATGPTSPRDWSDLRRRMRDLGVTRYEVEGDPQGRSRFRCLIPLAGRRAVGQQFEGEGDDDYQAAEAALRRVALWKATEMAPQ